MTSWVWMKGIDVAVADPAIDPVVPEDKREKVKDLVEQYSDKIEKVKEGLADDPLYDPTKHDDLWILRFVMSHKKAKPSLKAAKHTLEFRKKHNLDDEDIRDKYPHKLTSGNVYEYWKERCNGDAIICVHPDPQRGVLMFLTFGHFNTDAANTLSDEVWDEAFIYTSEFVHQWLDYTTRTTGLLTKSVRFIDLRGATFKHFDRKSTQRDGKSKFVFSYKASKVAITLTLFYSLWQSLLLYIWLFSLQKNYYGHYTELSPFYHFLPFIFLHIVPVMGQMEDCYPQLLGQIFACYPPTFMHWIWSVVRPIMPKRIIDKVDIIEPSKNDKERDRLLEHITLETLPVDFGGLNTVAPKDW